MKKKILITGGNGFLGINLAVKLKKKYKIILGSRNQKKNLEASYKTGCSSVPLDVANINSIRDALSTIKPEIIIHAAATKFVDISEKFAFECSDVNILGSTNIARAAIENNIKTVIGISTDKAAQPIKNFYGFSKAAMEKLFTSASKLSNTSFLCVRYGNVAWSTGSVLPIWKKMFLKDKKIFTTGPYMRRFFLKIDQAVNLVEFALNNTSKFNGKIVSVEMKSCKMIDIIKTWIKFYGGRYKIVTARKGDRFDEYLIGENELKYTYKLKHKKNIYFIIDFNKKPLKPIKNMISSANCKKLSISEIKDIIDHGINN